MIDKSWIWVGATIAFALMAPPILRSAGVVDLGTFLPAVVGFVAAIAIYKAHKLES